MRLKQFRMRGFRSVEDSGDVHLANDITILAGKNESGKSALLDGLATLLNATRRDLSSERTFDYEGDPRLWVNFEANETQIEALYKEAGLEFDTTDPDLREVRVTTTGHSLEFEGVIYDRVVEEADTLERTLRKGLGKFLDEEHGSTDLDADLDTLLERCREMVDACKDEDDGGLKETLESEMKHLDALSEAWRETHARADKLYKTLTSFLPSVIHFSSFDDQLPDLISLADEASRERKIVKDFCVLSGLDLDKLAGAEDSFVRKRIADDATHVYSEQFGKFWKQEPLEVGTAVDGDELLFTVKATGEKNAYRPSQRSRGLQWYTSFFITLSAHKGESNGGIILIDEPGLYLHAKAQQEIVRVMEDLCASGYQLIIGTHSPYLMQAERLDRIRLVIKDDKLKRTTVHPSWYSGADKETLTPVLTAIGLDGMPTVPGVTRWNVVIEGPTDYYYLQAMRHWFDQQGAGVLREGVAFVPCLGHANAGLIASLLLGWGRECVIVLDRKGTRKTYNKLITQGFPEHRIFLLGQNDDESTLDLFTRQDQREILNLPLTETNGLVSQVVKTIPSVSETILARQFFDNVLRGDQPEFTKGTIANFQRVFSQIESAFPDKSAKQMPVGVEA